MKKILMASILALGFMSTSAFAGCCGDGYVVSVPFFGCSSCNTCTTCTTYCDSCCNSCYYW